MRGSREGPSARQGAVDRQGTLVHSSGSGTVVQDNIALAGFLGPADCDGPREHEGSKLVNLVGCVGQVGCVGH